MKTAALIVLSCLPAVAHAQELNLGALDAEPNRVHVSTGAEYGMVASAGYSRVLPFLDRRLVLGGEATLPWAGADVQDYRLQLSALAPIVESTHWKLAMSLAPIVRGTENRTSRMIGVGVDAGLVGGYYDRRWFAAAEAGFDAALTTHVAISEAYRTRTYMGAQDGWYANAGGNVRAGLQLGASFGRYDVALRAGQVRDVGGGKPMLPFYGGVTLAARW